MRKAAPAWSALQQVVADPAAAPQSLASQLAAAAPLTHVAGDCALVGARPFPSRRWRAQAGKGHAGLCGFILPISYVHSRPALCGPPPRDVCLRRLDGAGGG